MGTRAFQNKIGFTLVNIRELTQVPLCGAASLGLGTKQFGKLQ
jgi:hypothetical protein